MDVHGLVSPAFDTASRGGNSGNGLVLSTRTTTRRFSAWPSAVLSVPPAPWSNGCLGAAKHR